ncbi:pyridoxamine 5'-phosphate oxidase family protein [Paenibacillus sp. CGMCC 1.18879]|uniref:pyridoxamine 5'-phosphate oxidase family protein n=1 Tax=Paenibacillus sp. CGMCC 1.18879 TaxID=2834466 RepID=UPI001CA9693B|nr:pyridoxamine 5'-phosphate oxidase family protein [Paenibacillus sp. CGMCC 1.18879]MBY9079334.1 pyridoxamine 5'-phosphate oxidase family protein [Paenibacillus sp. CGMCC 1.18879]
MEQAELKPIISLVEDARTIIVSSVDENDYPNSKQMFKRGHDGMKKFWFSTNTSSMRTKQFLANPRASLYFVGESSGLMLIGDMKVCHDIESKKRIWEEGDEQYYPLGVDDPDYCVFEFTALSGNYYSNLGIQIFTIS